MKCYFMNEFVSMNKFPIDDVLQIRAAFKDANSHCKMLSNYKGLPPADTYWKSHMTEANQRFFYLLIYLSFSCI